MKSPAPYAALNSITDQPDVGDERNFVRARLAGSSANYTDYVRADVRDRVELSVAVFNDAADNLAGSASSIHGLYAKFAWPQAGTDSSIGITLGGKNVTEVWDGVTVLTSEPVVLSVLRDSAVMRTNAGDFPIEIESDYLHELTLGWSRADGEYPVGYSQDGKYMGNG